MDGGNSQVIEWGVAERALPGETQSGDRHVVKEFQSGVLVGVVDGLGHGGEAGLAAERAIGALLDVEPRSLISLVRHCHEKLQGTRGAVMNIAFFHGLDETLTWLGVGNVEGILLRGDTHAVPSQEFLLMRGGVVGNHLPQVAASILPVQRGDLLIFATDGIRSGFAEHLDLWGSAQQIADNILERHWRGTDDALVLVARYVHHRDEASPR